MSSKTRLRTTASYAATIVFLIAAEARAGYSILDLGPTAAGSSGIGAAINAGGSVAGTLRSGSGTAAALSTGGSPLGPVSLAAIGHVGSSNATGINDVGQVTGSYYNTSDRLSHAYRTADGKAVNLGTLDAHPGGVVTITSTGTTSAGINASGQIVGSSSLSDGTTRALRGDSSGTLSFLPSIGDGQFSQGSGINDGGRVVGTFESMPGITHAFYTDAANNPVDILKHYTLGGFGVSSFGTAINASGAFVGYGDFGLSSYHAFLAPVIDPSSGPARTPVVDLGVLGGFTSSYALGINATSQVVGKLDNQGSDPTAFVYDSTRGMIDLRTLLSAGDRSVWGALTVATAINDGLQITGQGIVDGQFHAFLMTPIAGESPFLFPATVPAPPGLVLSGLGCGLVAAFARLRRGRTAARAGA